MFSKDRKIKSILVNMDESLYYDFDKLCKDRMYNKNAVIRRLMENFINDKKRGK